MNFNPGRRHCDWQFPHSAVKFLEFWRTEIPCRYITFPEDDTTADSEIILAVEASTFGDNCGGGGVLYFPESKIGRCYQINFLSDLGVHLDRGNPSEAEVLNLLFSLCLFKQTLVNRKRLRILFDNISIRNDHENLNDPIVRSAKKVIKALKKEGTQIINDYQNWYDFRPKANDLLEIRLIGIATRLAKGFPIPHFSLEYSCFTGNYFYMVTGERVRKHKHLFSKVSQRSSDGSSEEELEFTSDQLREPNIMQRRNFRCGESLRFGQWEFSFTPQEFFDLKYSQIQSYNTQYPDEYEMILAVDGSGKVGSNCGGGGVLYFPRLKQGLCYRMNFLNHLNVHIDYGNSAEIETLNVLFSLCLFKQALINQKKLKILCDSQKLFNDTKKCPIVYSIRKILLHMRDTGTEIHNISNYFFLPVDLFEERLVGVADILSKGREIPEFKDNYRILYGNEFTLMKVESFRNYTDLFSKAKDLSNHEESSEEEEMEAKSEDYHNTLLRRRRNIANNLD